MLALSPLISHARVERNIISIIFSFSHTRFALNFSTHSSTSAKQRTPPLPPRPTLLDDVLTKKFLKGSGPGGQKINKTSSAVQLTHVPTGIVVKSQATRSRTQNEHIAKRILAEKIEFLEKGSESRVEKKRERASRKKRSAEKKSRRKYRRLESDKALDVELQGGEQGGEGEEGREFENGDDEDHGDGYMDVVEVTGAARSGRGGIDSRRVRDTDTVATKLSEEKSEFG